MNTLLTMADRLKLIKTRNAALSILGICALTLHMERAAQAVSFSGADSRIVYAGRTVADSWPYSPDGKRVKFYWSGAEIHIKFSGSTSIRMNMRVTEERDGNGNLIVPGTPVSFAYILDGQPLTNTGTGWNPPIRHDNILTLGDTQTVATGLTTGTHTLTIRNDVDSNSVSFLETLILDDGATLQQADPLPPHRIEFYGDSVTIGGSPIQTGVAPAGSDQNDDQYWTGSNWYNYVGQTSRNFNADFRIAAKGGMGVKYGFALPLTLRDCWNKIGPNGNLAVYDTSKWKPDVAVLAIGQNDQFNYPTNIPYSQAYQGFSDAYLAQIRDLRNAYPSAVIICMNTTMTDPGFFSNVFMAVQNDPTLGADPKILLKTNPNQNYGSHPHIVQHKQIADNLTQWISSATGWTVIGGGGGGGTLGTADTSLSGSYTLAPACSTGSRLDANAGGTANGTKVQIWAANSTAPQTWNFVKLSNNIYKIQASYATGQVLDVNGSGGSGTIVQLWADNGSAAQQWAAYKNADGSETLVPQCSTSSALDVSNSGTANGTQVQIYSQNGGNAQKWTLTSVGGAITNVAQGKAASASSSWDTTTFTPAKSVDNNIATGWSPSGTDTLPWLEVDLGQAYTISQIKLVTRQDVDQVATRRNFTIWASNNPDMSQGHVVLGTQGSTALAYKATYSTTVTDTTKYRYIAALKTTNEYFFISELQVMGR